MQLRPYQDQALEATFEFWRNGGGSPLIDLATGLGKSVVVAKLCQRLRQAAPDVRIMMLVHVRELVQQNFLQLLRVWPDAPVGVYSAGLNKRDIHKSIVFASIQSVYSKADVFGARHCVIVDEAHLIPNKSEGMYREFLDGLRATYPGLRVVGLTATPYRTDSGNLTTAEGSLFDEVVYHYGIGEATEDGWLCPLTAKAGRSEIDVAGVKKRGGEFVSKALQEAALNRDIVEAACDDLVERGRDRRSWLLFCTGVDHAIEVARSLQARGIAAETVTGKTPKDQRARILRDFKAGKIRALTNANVLTTGFDAPNVDLIAMLRPTLSTSLYVQMMGRGTRVDGVDLNAFESAGERRSAIAASRKPNCLVLDYAGNVRRHGPVDVVSVEDKRAPGEAEEEPGRVEADDVQAKECPECEELVAANARKCKFCGFEFGEPKHADTAEDLPVLSKEYDERWFKVNSWSGYLHRKKNRPDAVPTLRVDYIVGPLVDSVWMPFEHPGPIRAKAAKFWKDHGGNQPVPATCWEAAQRFAELRKPDEVQIDTTGKYREIKNWRYSDAGQMEEEE